MPDSYGRARFAEASRIPGRAAPACKVYMMSSPGEQRPILRRRMSVEEFDAGYYYATEIRAFAHELGIPVGNRRKTDLEDLIREFLRTREVPARRPVPSRKPGRARDELSLDTAVTNYVGDRATKEFMLEHVRAENPGIRNKSGQWYWLNDWRRRQQEAGRRFTYRDLVNHLRDLMLTEGRLPQIPSARMNNFITDFRADPDSPDMTRDRLLEEWYWLKQQAGPCTYAEYRRLRPHGTGLE